MPARTDARPASGPSRAQAPDLVLTREFDAPRALVWEAWTRAEHVARWWGPDGYKVTRCEWPARQGSALRIHIQGPDGAEWAMTGAFTEVAPPERLGFTGAPMDPSGAKMFEALSIATFADQGSKTLVTVDTWITSKPPLTVEQLAGMREGWTVQLGHLATLLPTLR